MFTDIRYAVRSLLRSKGFTLVTIITLALGIGSAGAIFSVVDWVLFRSVNFPPGVVFVGARDKQGQFNPWQIDAHARAYREMTNVFSDFGLASRQPVNIVLAGEPVQTGAVGVSANLLPMLGAVPRLGRGFLPGEDRDGHNQVVVITHEFWQMHFHGVDDVLGRELIVDQTVCKVVGVLPAKQAMPGYVHGDVYRPLVYRTDPAEPWSPPLFVFGQLRPGVSIPQAEQAMAGVKVDLPPQIAQFMALQKPSLSTLAELQKLTRPEIHWVLLGAVGFLYGIACLNATNLMLLRMLGKKRELSIRLALGGGRWRLIRLFVIESLGLSLAASGLGVIFANWFFPIFMTVGGAAGQGSWARWSLDWRALAVLGGLTLATGLAIVIVPALRILRADISAGLKDGGAALGESRRLARLRGGFVVLQAAFAVILLTGAGLMVRTFGKLQQVDLGFDTSRRVKVAFSLPDHYLPGNQERLALLRRLQEHLRHVPGVRRVAYGTDGLMTGYYYANWSVQLADGTPVNIKTDYLSPEYLETAGMGLKRGRFFRPGGGAEILVNEAFAHARFGDADPIGQFIKAVKNDQGLVGWTVAGVVRDVRENVRATSGYHIYGPDEWLPTLINSFIVQVSREPDAALSSALKRAVYEFDPKIVTYQISSLDQARDQQTGLERFALTVLKALSEIAIVLTVVGLFSVLAYTVDRRMGEFGIRLALGATPRNLMMLVMRRGVLLALAGIVLGLASSLALTRYLQSLLYETPPHDPLVLGLVALLLLVAAVGACALPAVRASKADVAQLLKAE
jgi:predicted permease